MLICSLLNLAWDFLWGSARRSSSLFCSYPRAKSAPSISVGVLKKLKFICHANIVTVFDQCCHPVDTIFGFWFLLLPPFSHAASSSSLITGMIFAASMSTHSLSRLFSFMIYLWQQYQTRYVLFCCLNSTNPNLALDFFTSRPTDRTEQMWPKTKHIQEQPGLSSRSVRDEKQLI